MPKYKVKMSHTTEFFIEAETQEELIDYMCEHTPDDFKEIIIDGGCHAYFGMYGEQKGDGKANITNEEQIKITASYITEMIKD
jgi:hypothetical protein